MIEKYSLAGFTLLAGICSIALATLGMTTKVASKLSEVSPSCHSTRPHPFFSRNSSNMDSSKRKLDVLISYDIPHPVLEISD